MARPDDDTDDRRALWDLVAAYARGVDRRRPADVAALFCDDGVLAIYDGDPDRVAPTRERNGRAEIATALERLEMYAVTTHFLGQQYVDVDGERATGETYCLAHHLSGDGDEQHNHVMSIRYLDGYHRVDGRWLIARRRLVIDWTEDRLQTRR